VCVQIERLLARACRFDGCGFRRKGARSVFPDGKPCLPGRQELLCWARSVAGSRAQQQRFEGFTRSRARHGVCLSDDRPTKDRRKSDMSKSAPIAVLLFVLGAATSAHANTKLDCFPSSADKDNDGYAVSGTKSQQMTLSGAVLACPSGYVNKAGDCNDNDASIHPRRWEDAYNNYDGIDNDCDGTTDEPEPPRGRIS
jgi:hypothetical protein